MNCIECGGACCEEMELDVQPTDVFALEWLQARSAAELGRRPGVPQGAPPAVRLRFEARCPLLTCDGLCSVHESGKPAECSAAEAGQAWCLDVVRRRRTRAQYELIRGTMDPVSIHEEGK